MPGTVPDYPARLSSHVCLLAYLRTLKYQGAPFSRNTPSLIAAFHPIERVDPFPVTGKPLRPAVVAQPAQFLVPRAVLSHLTYSAVAEAVDFLPAPPEPRALSP